ncbi:MAG: AP2 domain-containing protein [Pirellulaceae bacterium]
MAEKSEKNISRIETNSNGSISKGFLVRVMRRGERFQKFFGDATFGSRPKALAAAKKFRDSVLKKNKGFSKKELANRASSRNTSGIVGVRYSEEVHGTGKNKRVYGFWVASWNPKAGVRKTKRYSIDKYGDDEAMQMAIKAREEGIRNFK